ncbi:nudC domain-containing protein 3-like [Copidosoma floridanum]|uniref:nudC domain-containing protein 3-like n=1 Tax=Copidosoma floridanum TaxID=29053 RepID=UPI0006C9DA16|nr:nudC domain-containing protein 3-like [Copidosoma floridanum]
MDHGSTVGTHDETLLGILGEEKNIAGFFDALFGFLYRCTDFYVETPPESESRVGLPPGLAEQLVLESLRKWRTQPLSMDGTTADSSERRNGRRPINHQVRFIGVLAERAPRDFSNPKIRSSADCYNGAAYDKYRWSQTIGDLDVLVPVPREIRQAKDARVHLDSKRLEVALRSADGGSWQTLLEGRFSHPIKNSESYWCLEPGEHLTLHLEKAGERWWEALLDDEPRIELGRIDCSRNLEEMPERERMKVEELVWSHRRKLLGQPTSDETVGSIAIYSDSLIFPLFFVHPENVAGTASGAEHASQGHGLKARKIPPTSIKTCVIFFLPPIDKVHRNYTRGRCPIMSKQGRNHREI